MYRLIIAEKPSVSQTIAYSIGANERVKDGKVSYYEGNGFLVANALGHLVGIGMPEDYGFGYVKALAQNFYGIQDVRKIEAVGFDIYGANVNSIMKDAEDTLSEMTLL